MHPHRQRVSALSCLGAVPVNVLRESQHQSGLHTAHAFHKKIVRFQLVISPVFGTIPWAMLDSAESVALVGLTARYTFLPSTCSVLSQAV